MKVATTNGGMCGGDNYGIDTRLESGRFNGTSDSREFRLAQGRTHPQARTALYLNYDSKQPSTPLILTAGSGSPAWFALGMQYEWKEANAD